MNYEHLREVTCELKQERGFTKRWFSCQSADLFTWYNKKTLARFEFCYNKHSNEHSLRWQQEIGFSHARIDDGENSGISKASPILIADKNINSDYIYEQFKLVSSKIDIEIRFFIMRKLIGISVEY